MGAGTPGAGASGAGTPGARIPRARTRAALAALALLAAGATAVVAQQGFSRAELQHLDYPDADHQAATYLVTVEGGGGIPRHTHPGVEMGYVVSGQSVLSVRGRPDQVLKAGESWAIPAGVPHALRNLDGGQARLVATFVVEKGKPLSSPAPE